MCKLFPVIVLTAVFGMTSCAPNLHHYVTSETFNNTIFSMQSQMADQGYEYTGCETCYEKLIQRINDKVQRATTYHFADSLDNTMKYSVVYRKKLDGREEYIYGFDFCECEVSDPKDYERLCGIIEVAGQNLPQMNTRKYLTKEEIEVVLSLVQSQLASQGFKMKGKSTLRHYYERFNGWRTDTHHFLDSMGNTADVSIRYFEQKNQDGVYEVELCGCITSNPEDVDKICGKDGVVKQMKELPKD